MFVDWRQPPKSLNDYWSGKYHQEWRPLINRRLAFNREDWRRLVHSYDCGEFYQVEDKATVHLDLGFIELDWCLFAKLDEWYGFEMRSERRGFRPPIMVHVGSEHKKVWQEMMIR